MHAIIGTHTYTPATFEGTELPPPGGEVGLGEAAEVVPPPAAGEGEGLGMSGKGEGLGMSGEVEGLGMSGEVEGLGMSGKGEGLGMSGEVEGSGWASARIQIGKMACVQHTELLELNHTYTACVLWPSALYSRPKEQCH